MTAIKPLENFDDVTLRLAHYICQLTLICHNNSANKISDIAGGIRRRGDSRDRASREACDASRAREREATRSGKKKKERRGTVLLNRLLPKKLRSGKEQERLRGAGTEGGRERQRERRRERRLTSTFSCVRSAGAMFVLGNAITLSYKI